MRAGYPSEEHVGGQWVHVGDEWSTDCVGAKAMRMRTILVRAPGSGKLEDRVRETQKRKRRSLFFFVHSSRKPSDLTHLRSPKFLPSFFQDLEREPQFCTCFQEACARRTAERGSARFAPVCFLGRVWVVRRNTLTTGAAMFLANTTHQRSSCKVSPAAGKR